MQSLLTRVSNLHGQITDSNPLNWTERIEHFSYKFLSPDDITILN